MALTVETETLAIAGNPGKKQRKYTVHQQQHKRQLEQLGTPTTAGVPVLAETPVEECMLTTVGTLAIAVTPSTSGAIDRAETQVTAVILGTLTEGRNTAREGATAAQETTEISRKAYSMQERQNYGNTINRVVYHRVDTSNSRDVSNSREVNNIRDPEMLETPVADKISTAEMAATAETLSPAGTPGMSTAAAGTTETAETITTTGFQ